MPTDYTLAEISHLTGVTPRTVRYYIQAGVLPPPTGQGPAARYSEAHLERLRLIKKLQAAHLPLAEIRRQLQHLPDDQLETVARSEAGPVSDSALDYVHGLLAGKAPAQASFALAAPPAPSLPPPMESAAKPDPTSEPPREPERAQWERISLDPDIEIHVRRPLSRLQNKRVERLVSIARQLLEED
jgi:DNA-binding transcriptional MerR regulator